MAKRLLDVMVSVLGLIFLAPFFFIFAVLIKLSSRGPVLYTQERVGRGVKLFILFKFRTMQIDADKADVITVGKHDLRITSVGYWLRKFKLDELPQLINVLRGEMSLVGPRPELKKFVDLYNREQLKVISVKPGMTDYASIQFRNENELLEGKEDPIDFYIKKIIPVKLELNLKYIKERNFWRDIGIIMKTIVLIFKPEKI